jgi:hypothetical protein
MGIPIQPIVFTALLDVLLTFFLRGNPRTDLIDLSDGLFVQTPFLSEGILLGGKVQRMDKTDT